MADVTLSQSNGGGALQGGGSVLRAPGMAFCALTPGSLPPRKRLSVGWKQNGCTGVMFQSNTGASVLSLSTPQPQNRHHSQAPSSSTCFSRPSPARPPDEKRRFGGGGKDRSEERREGEEGEEEFQREKEKREVLSELRWGTSVKETAEVNAKNRCSDDGKLLPRHSLPHRRSATGPRTPRELVISTVGLGSSAGTSICGSGAGAGESNCGTSHRQNKHLTGKCSHCRSVGSGTGESAEDDVNGNSIHRPERPRCAVSITLPTEEKTGKEGGQGCRRVGEGFKSAVSSEAVACVEQQQQQKQGLRREQGREELPSAAQSAPVPPPPPSTPPSSSKMSASVVRLPIWGSEFSAVKSSKSNKTQDKLKGKPPAVPTGSTTEGSGGGEQNPALAHHPCGGNGDGDAITGSSTRATAHPPQVVESCNTKKDGGGHGNVVSVGVNRNILKTRNTVDVCALPGGAARCAKSAGGCGATTGEGGGESSSGSGLCRGSTLRLPINIILPSRSSPVRKKPRGGLSGSKETPAASSVDSEGGRHRFRQNGSSEAGVVVIKVTASAATAAAFSGPRPSSTSSLAAPGSSNGGKSGDADGPVDRVSSGEEDTTVGGAGRRSSGCPALDTSDEGLRSSQHAGGGEGGSGSAEGGRSPPRVTSKGGGHHPTNGGSGAAAPFAGIPHAASSSSGGGSSLGGAPASIVTLTLEKANITPTACNLNALSSPPRSPSSGDRRSPSPPRSPSPARFPSAPRSPPRSVSPARPAFGTQEAADAARAEAALKIKLAAAARAAANGKAAVAARAAAAAKAAIEYAALAKQWEMNAKAQQQQRKARSALMRGLGVSGGDGKAAGGRFELVGALGALKLELSKLKADRGERLRGVVLKGEKIREDGVGSEEVSRGGGGGCISSASSPIDDEELARRLHRAINSSPRISGSLPLKRKNSMDSSSSGGCGGRWVSSSPPPGIAQQVWGASIGFAVSDGPSGGEAAKAAAPLSASASASACPRPSSYGNCQSHASIRERASSSRENAPAPDKVGVSPLLRHRHGPLHELGSGMLLWNDKDEAGPSMMGSSGAGGKLRAPFSGSVDREQRKGGGAGRAEGSRDAAARSPERKITLKRLEQREKGASSSDAEKAVTQRGAAGGTEGDSSSSYFREAERSRASVPMMLWKDGSAAAGAADEKSVAVVVAAGAAAAAAAGGVSNAAAGERGNAPPRGSEAERGEDGGGGGAAGGGGGVCASALVVSASFSRKAEALAGSSLSAGCASGAAAAFATTGEQQEKLKGSSVDGKGSSRDPSLGNGSADGATKVITLSLVKRRTGSSPKRPDRSYSPKGPPTPPPLCLASISASAAGAGLGDGHGVSSMSGQGSSPCASAGASPPRRASSPRSPETPSSAASALHHHHHHQQQQHHYHRLTQGNGAERVEKATLGVLTTEAMPPGGVAAGGSNAVTAAGGGVCLSNRSVGSGSTCVTAAVRVKVVSEASRSSSGGRVSHHHHAYYHHSNGATAGAVSSLSPPAQAGEQRYSSQFREVSTLTSKGTEKSDYGMAQRLRPTTTGEKRTSGSAFAVAERACGRPGGGSGAATGISAGAGGGNKEGAGIDVWVKGEEGLGSIVVSGSERHFSQHCSALQDSSSARGSEEREGVRAGEAMECSAGPKDSRSCHGPPGDGAAAAGEALPHLDDEVKKDGDEGCRGEEASKFVRLRSLGEGSGASRASDADELVRKVVVVGGGGGGGGGGGEGERSRHCDESSDGTRAAAVSLAGSKEAVGGDLEAATRGRPSDASGVSLAVEGGLGLDCGAKAGAAGWDVPSGNSKGFYGDGWKKRKIRENSSDHERNRERREFRASAKRTVVIPLGLISRANRSSSCAAVCSGVGATARDGGGMCEDSSPSHPLQNAGRMPTAAAREGCPNESGGTGAGISHVSGRGDPAGEGGDKKGGGPVSSAWRGGESNQDYCSSHKGCAIEAGQLSIVGREGCRSPISSVPAMQGAANGGAGGVGSSLPSVECGGSSSFRSHQANGKSATTAVTGKTLLGFGNSSGFGMVSTMISLPTTAALANGPRRA